MLDQGQQGQGLRGANGFGRSQVAWPSKLQGIHLSKKVSRVKSNSPTMFNIAGCCRDRVFQCAFRPRHPSSKPPAKKNEMSLGAFAEVDEDDD